MYALTLNRLIDFTETSGLYHTNQLFKKKCFQCLLGSGWKRNPEHREGVCGKKEVEVKEYLKQLFLHSAMLSFCKAPNLHDSWGIKKKKEANLRIRDP